jgi:outer membrane lipoprotein
MRLYVLPLCVFLSACAGLPAAVKNVPVSKLSYTHASTDPNSYKGTLVRWGGVIIDVENEENETLVQVLSYPLDYTGRPQLTKQSEGRFVVKSAEFLDPAVYKKDREITVAGELEGDIDHQIGKKTVRLPLLSSTAIYMWPIYQAYPYGYGYGGYGGYGGWGPWGSPYYGYGYYGPYWGGYGRPYW